MNYLLSLYDCENWFVNPVERQRDNHVVFQKQREIKARGLERFNSDLVIPEFWEYSNP